ncbi:alpha/beta-hydrolase [Calocera viscosa TUFC12733]|uniref:Alpha/beta-hydrolase n=1 Tax=Calocera viscosa (strain TUFC12733) TaxID=1330018 RepID=A0A167HEQ6_CALVF|nr:alpha/beta-hydrolase [Calocera viscosa TUFC12733]
MSSRLVSIPVAGGSIALEGALFTPAEPGRKLAVMCHPWSWLGGSMDDYVLHLLTPVFLRHSYAVLRYNSRGVGSSTGRATLRGEGEVADLREVVQWGIGLLGEEAERVVLGYSHGSLITSRQPCLPNIPTSHLLISYPTSVLHWLTLFSSSTYRAALLHLAQEKGSDVLAVYGDKDNFSGEAALDRWAGELRSAGEGGRVRTEKVEGADHFWGGEAGERLAEIVAGWLAER